jgi:hypothetical protein
MGTWTIETTVAEDEAIDYAYQQSQKPIWSGAPLPPPETIEEFFNRRTHDTTVLPMLSQHTTVKQQELLATLATIPPENRDAALTDLEAVVTAHGGTVTLRDATYLWSDTLTGAPPDRTVMMDVSQADVMPVTRLYFDDQDVDSVLQRAGLLAVALGTLVRLEDPRNTAHFLLVVTTAAAIGQPGYVELPVEYRQQGGPLAAAWPMTCTFT